MPPSFRFSTRHKLTHAREFSAVFAARMRKSTGPLAVFVLPSDRPTHRLGLSVGRVVGNAVVRNRLKRMIREAFRLLQRDIPKLDEATGYDIVVSAKPHSPLSLEQYQTLLMNGIAAADRDQRRRRERAGEAPGEP
ncbi:MAG: ribonuclease P protein component [Tepidisphaera sp.]